MGKKKIPKAGEAPKKKAEQAVVAANGQAAAAKGRRSRGGRMRLRSGRGGKMVAALQEKVKANFVYLLVPFHKAPHKKIWKTILILWEQQKKLY